MLPYHAVTGKSHAPKLLRRHSGPPNPSLAETRKHEIVTNNELTTILSD